MFEALITSIMFEKLITILLVLLFAWLTNTILQRLIRIPTKFQTRRAKTVTTIFKNTLSIALYTFSFYLIFKILEIDVTPILASAGIAGLALGFGARSLIEDLLSGLFLLIENSLVVGDLIRIGNIEGMVKKITFRTVTIQDKQGIFHIIPNGQIKILANLSRAKARINIDLTLSTEQAIDNFLAIAAKTIEQLKNDQDLGQKILEESAVKGIEEFLPKGQMVVKIILVTPWREQWKIARRYRYLLKKNLEKAKISLG